MLPDGERRGVSQKFLLDVSPTGVEHHVHIEDDGDTLIAVEHTPTRIESEILDTCAQMRSLHHSAHTANLKHAARIPINTYNQWRREWMHERSRGSHITWQQFEVAKLNSRNNHKLRTGHKRSAFGMKL